MVEWKAYFEALGVVALVEGAEAMRGSQNEQHEEAQHMHTRDPCLGCYPMMRYVSVSFHVVWVAGLLYIVLLVCSRNEHNRTSCKWQDCMCLS